MNPLDHDRHPPRPERRPGHERDDSRQEREKDYVKEVRPPRGAAHARGRGSSLH